MLFVNLLKISLLFAGPIVGYQFAMRRPVRRRWKTIVSCAAGGAVASLPLIGIMLFSELSWFSTTGDLIRAALAAVDEYALFGFVLGLATTLTPLEQRPHVFRSGLTIVGLIALIAVAIDAAHHLAEKGGGGIVIRQGGARVKDARVFLDPGFGALVRLTTDTAGQFRAPPMPDAYARAQILICAPGVMPKLERLYGTAVSVYQVTPLPPRSHTAVRSRLRLMGWSAPIPRECLAHAT